MEEELHCLFQSIGTIQLDQTNKITFRDCAFVNNNVGSKGGAIFLAGESRILVYR